MAKTLLKYYLKIVEAKEKQKEFTMRLNGNMQLLTVVPKRTSSKRKELTVEELYILLYLQDEGIIKNPNEALEWIAW